MAIIDYPNLTECLEADGFPDRPDGWFLKHLDTGEIHHRVAGEWVNWGLGLSFAPPTKSGLVVTGPDGQATVTFVTPFYDTNYTITMTCRDKPGHPPIALFISKMITGFTLKTVSSRSGQPLPGVTISWLVTRDFNA